MVIIASENSARRRLAHDSQTAVIVFLTSRYKTYFWTALHKPAFMHHLYITTHIIRFQSKIKAK